MGSGGGEGCIRGGGPVSCGLRGASPPPLPSTRLSSGLSWYDSSKTRQQSHSFVTGSYRFSDEKYLVSATRPSKMSATGHRTGIFEPGLVSHSKTLAPRVGGCFSR